VWALIGFIDYRASERFKQKNGVTPWHWPSWVWAFVGFVFGLLSAIPMLIATRTTKSKSAVSPPTAGPTQPGAMPGDWATGDRVPAYVGSPMQSDAGSVAGASGHQYRARAAHPPAWLDDPTGRFASRYWDGSRWTEHVSDGSSTATDPV
jgi:hypothetical protein